jgi:hypothetical protein
MNKHEELFDKITHFNSGQLTRFMRKIKVFGENDYVCVYDKHLIGDIVDNEHDKGYHVYVDFSPIHGSYIYVKHIDSQYLKCVNIKGLSDLDWNSVFNLNKIVDDFCEELEKFV